MGSVPQVESDLLHSLASFSLTEQAGTVAFAVLDAAPLPLAEVELTLLRADGTPSPANVHRRFFVYDGVVPRLFPGQVTGPFGLGAFFNVPPGRYRLRATRAGYTFPEPSLEVRGGAVTLDLVEAQELGAPPAPFTGRVTHLPLLSQPYSAVPAPLADVQISVRLDDDTTVEARTDGDGRYTVGLPRLARWFDVTAQAPGYEPLRTRQVCAGHYAFQDFLLEDRFDCQQMRLYALGSRPLEPDAGTVVVWFRDVPRGTRVTLEAPAPPFFYGAQPAAYSCDRGPCAGDADCAPQSRCEAGRCVVGVADGGLCRRCETTACPAGYFATQFPVDGGAGCFCHPAPGSCDPSGLTCEPGTYCATYTGLDAGVRVGVGNACTLYRPLANEVVTTDAGALPATAPNVPEGEYTVEVHVDGGRLGSARVRVSPGVTNQWSYPD